MNDSFCLSNPGRQFRNHLPEVLGLKIMNSINSDKIDKVTPRYILNLNAMNKESIEYEKMSDIFSKANRAVSSAFLPSLIKKIFWLNLLPCRG